jgi:hypothetical protein
MRLNPATWCEHGVAVHEAGHMVAAVLLERHRGLLDVAIWEAKPDDDAWEGRCTAMDNPVPLPERHATPPQRWASFAREAWADLVGVWCGPAAACRYKGDALDAQTVRADDSGQIGDVATAGRIAAHFWPGHREEALESAADVAGLLVQIPALWGAIEAVAGYLVMHARHRAGIAEIETLVRRFIPMSFPCPGSDWAAGLALT